MLGKVLPKIDKKLNDSKSSRVIKSDNMIGVIYK